MGTAEGLEQEKDSNCQYEQTWGWDKTSSGVSRVTAVLQQSFNHGELLRS